MIMVYSEHTPVEQKRHKKPENDQWRLLMDQCFNKFCLKGFVSNFKMLANMNA